MKLARKFNPVVKAYYGDNQAAEYNCQLETKNFE